MEKSIPTIIKNAMRFVINPKARFNYLTSIGFYNWMSDKAFLERKWKVEFGKKLNLENPKTFDEKMQWLKLYNRKDIYTIMVDKNEVKKFVTKTIGEKYIIPTLGVYNKFDEINFCDLPNQFVIKCTHDSGGQVICRDKKKLDIEAARKKINKSLKVNYYYRSREWPYKNVRPKIIVEQYMSEVDGKELTDYKIFNFNGDPKIVLICTDRNKNLKKTWYDDKFRMLDITEGGHERDFNVSKPEHFDEMLRLSRKLSRGIPFVRIDFYEIKGKVYFGEITFYPASGFERFEPKIWNRKFGDFIELPIVKDGRLDSLKEER